VKTLPKRRRIRDALSDAHAAFGRFCARLDSRMRVRLTSLCFGLAVVSSLHGIANAQAPGASATNDWKPIGPMPIVGMPVWGNREQIAKRKLENFSGAVFAITSDPRNGSIIYIGTAAGGVWKSTDNGKTWKPLTDNQPVSAIGCITLDPSNPDIIYAGTGSDFHSGSGILKSADAGTTWTFVKAYFGAGFAGLLEPHEWAAGGVWIRSIAVNRSDGNVILAAAYPRPSILNSTHGIHRSTDGGKSWRGVLPQVDNSVVFHPTDPNIAFAAGAGGVFKSIDRGLTWSPINGHGNNTLPANQNFWLTIVTSRPNTMFAAAPAGKTGMNIWRTVDGGETWILMAKPPIDGIGPDGDQVALAASPTNSEILFAGGVNLCRSTNGGKSWADVIWGANGLALHSDIRALAFTRDGKSLFVGDDGGIWVTNQPGASRFSWSDLNTTLATVMFYPHAFAVQPGANMSVGGTQDNGLVAYQGGNAWYDVLKVRRPQGTRTGGDGGSPVFDSGSPPQLYTTSATDDGRIWKWIPAERLFVEKTSGIDWSEFQQKPWGQNALAVDPSNRQRIYYGWRGIYQSSDGAEHWRQISWPAGKGHILAISIASSDPNTVWAGGSSGLIVTRNALSGSPKWDDHKSGLPLKPVTQIAVSPSEPTTAYVTLEGYDRQRARIGHLFKTTDGGATWSDLSSQLPNESAFDIVIDPDMPNTLYVAMEGGVFVSNDDGRSWFELGKGLPKVAVTNLKLIRSARILRAATWGRSAWDLNIPRDRGALTQLMRPISATANSFATESAENPPARSTNAAPTPYVPQLSENPFVTSYNKNPATARRPSPTNPPSSQILQNPFDTGTRENPRKTGGYNAVAPSSSPAPASSLQGIQFKVIRPGTGAQPGPTDVVTFNYRGKLLSGTEFDSSYKRGQPAKHPVNGVIKGLTEAFQLMSVGGKYEVIIPSQLAYGDRSPFGIPPNSALVFEVELLDTTR
jgi:photosystem II stability/assembly factor-like uncharacterized protein